MELQVIRSRSSFRRQIILTFVVGFCLLIAAFAVYMVLTERENLHRDNVDETTSMAQSLAVSALPWVLADDVAGLQEVVHAYRGYPDFSYAMVISPKGRVIAHSDPSKTGLYLSDPQSLDMLKSPHTIRIMEDSADRVDVAVPIELGKQQVGWARVSELKTASVASLRTMVRNIIVFLLVSTALSFLAATIIANRLGRHIRTMVRVAEAVQSGNYSTRISVREGEDEIARLGNSLNMMLETLTQNEAALRESTTQARRFSDALDNVTSYVYIKNRQHQYVHANKPTLKLFGCTAEELNGSDDSRFFPPATVAQLKEVDDRVLEKGEQTQEEIKVIGDDGKTIYYLEIKTPIYDTDGTIWGLCGISYDITERKQAEVTLRESEEALKEAQRIAHVGSWYLDLATNQVYWSEELYNMYGYDPALPPPLYTESAKLFTPESWDRLSSAIARAAETGAPYELELEMVSIRGRKGWMLAIGEQVRDEHGKPVRVRGVAMDITERKQAEEVLRSASQYSRSLIEASLDPLVTISPEGKITDVNAATEKVTGRSRDELVSADFSEYFTEPDKARAGYKAVFEKGFVTDYPLVLRRKDGHLTDVLYNASLYRDEAGKVLGVFAAARDVTERNKAEEAVRKNEALLQAIMKILPVGVWMLDANGQVIFGNDAAQRIWSGVRYVGIEQLGEYKGWWADSGKPVGPHDWAGSRAVEKGEIVTGEEVEIECFDGTRKFILDSAVPLHNDDGSIRGAVTVNLDITERKKAELEREQYFKFFNVSTDLMGIADPNGAFKKINPAFTEQLGYSRDEMLSRPFIEFVHPDDRQSTLNEMERQLKLGYTLNFENRYICKDGSIKWISWRANINYNDGLTYAAGRDITERKQALEALKASEAQLREAQRIAHVGNWNLDLVSNTLTWSDEIYRIFEIDPEKFGASYEAFLDAIHPEDRDMVNQAYTSSVANRTPYDIVHRLLMKDGRIKYINEKCETHYAEDGKPLRSVGTVHDITERKRAEDALFEAQEVFRTLVENSPDIITRYDRELRRTYVNPTYLKTAGMQKGALIGSTPAQASPLPPESAAQLLQLLRKVMDTGVVAEIDVIWPREDNIDHWYNIFAFPEFDRAGRVASVMTMSREITARKEAEEQVRKLNAELEERVQARTAALEAANKELEAFSYSVSHDLRSPLRAIDGFSNILMEDYAGKLDNEGKRLVGVVRDNAIRMARLIDDILAFSRLGRKELLRQAVDMRQLANETASDLAPAMEGREVRLEIGELPPAHGDASMLRQVWANLLGNAVKFTRKCKVAEISVSGQTEGNELVYCIRDNGAGFDMQYANKLFGVFSRLHSAEEFEGTGAGLAIVKRIITRHGGRVWGEGKVDEGATFWFALPAGDTGDDPAKGG